MCKSVETVILPDKPSEKKFFEEEEEGYCTYSCRGWPYRTCWVWSWHITMPIIPMFYKMRHNYQNGGWRRGSCTNPYVDKSEKFIWGNYPEWEQSLLLIQLIYKLPRCDHLSTCQRCDDFCAAKDGKSGRDDYQEKTKKWTMFKKQWILRSQVLNSR